MERTLGLIKPDAVAARHVGEVISAIENAEMHVIAVKFIRLSREQAEGFYGIHRGKPFYEELIGYITSGPLVVLALEGEQAVHHWRELLGPTNPEKAPKTTLRGRFGIDITMNACHGSDSAETAASELAYFFSALDFVHYDPQ